MARRRNKPPSKGHVRRARLRSKCICTPATCLSGCDKCRLLGGPCCKSPERNAEFSSAAPATETP